MSPRQIEAIVLEFEAVAASTVELRLRVPSDFSFLPGQFVSLTIPALADLPATQGFHDFSIASSPAETGVIRLAFRNTGSHYKQRLLALQPGDKLELYGPQGVFVMPTDQPVVAIAGGIGITAFVGAVIDRPQLRLLYYNRMPDSAAYLRSLEQQLGNRLRSFFGAPTSAQLSQVIAQLPVAQWFIAGPPGFVASIRQLLKALSVDDTMIRTEEFTGYDTRA